MKYKKVRESTCILRVADGVYFPQDPANTDFQEYQRWLAEGNTPEPASQNPDVAALL